MSSLSITLTIITAIIIIMLPATNNYNYSIKILLTILTVAVIIVFISNNLINIFIAFETSIIPTIIIITNYGNYPERATANIFIIIITITCSLPIIMLAANLSNENNAIINTINNNFSENEEQLYLLAILVFLANIPMFILHIWLPNAHVQAPTVGSIVLAGIILKLGGFGAIVITNTLNLNNTNKVITLSIISAATIALLSIRQSDNNTIIAYSSVSHIIFIITNISSAIIWTENSTIISILSHGIISPLIFIIAGETTEEQSTNNNVIAKSSKSSSLIATTWLLVIAANISAPPTINFIIEIEMLINILNNNASWVITVSIAAISILCINIATNFAQGNNKTPANPNTNEGNNLITVIILIISTALIIASTNFSYSLDSHVKPGPN